MKVKIKRENLLPAVQDATKALPARTTLPILTHMFLYAEDSELVIRATDLEIGVEIRCPAEIAEKGGICIPGKLFADIVGKTTSPDIEMSAVTSDIEITAGKSIYNIVGSSVKEFPSVDFIDDGKIITINQLVFKQAVEKIVDYTSKEQSRPVLTGLNFSVKEGGKMEIAGLDGYRLAVLTADVTTDTAEPFSFIVPAKTLKEIVKVFDKIGTMDILVSDTNVMFVSDTTRFISRLIVGKYMDYDKILQGYQALLTTTVNKAQLMDSISRAMILNPTTPVILDITKGQIVIKTSSSLGKVVEHVEADSTGELKIAFNGRFLLEHLKLFAEEKLTLEFTNNVSPVLTKNATSVAIVLPIKYNDAEVAK
jgi:DNA polymerase-3 subunit beta